MSESLPSVPDDEPTGKPPEARERQDKRRSYTVALWVVAVTVPATLGTAIFAPRDIRDAFGVLLTALATAVVAVFTFTLWDATREIRESADSTAERQFGVMEQQRVVMARQQVAMEAQVIAMVKVAQSIAVSAAAAQEAANITKRMLAAQHPPALRLEVYIEERADGALVLNGSIWNDGGTNATIKTTYMRDAVYRAADPNPKADAAQNDPALVGAEIPSHMRIEFIFQCRDIRKSDLRPVRSTMIAAAFGVTRIDTGEEPKPPPLQFSGFITFVNEGGRFEMIQFNLTCEPTSRSFASKA